MLAGAWVVGATWDEKTHVLMLDTFLKQGWNVTPDALLANGTPDPAYIWGVYVYGPVGELVSHATTAALGLEPWGEPAYTAAAYAGRHIGVALMALAGAAAAAAIVRLITRSWGFGLLGAAILLVTPLWTGHGMFNIKDTPVAAGYTIGTLGVVALVSPGFRRSRWATWGGVAALVVGAVLASGTREAMGVPLAAAAVVAPLVLLVLNLRDRGTPWSVPVRDALLRLAFGVGSLILAYLALVAIYPKAYANPFTLAWQALVVSARFPFDEQVLTAGVWMNQPPPWTYLPLWFLAQLPLLVIAGSLFAGVWWGVAVIRRLAVNRGVDGPPVLAMTFAVGLQLVMLPLVGIVLRSNMYNGSRQFLFVVPAAAILTAVAIWIVVRWLQSRGVARWAVTAAWVVVMIGVLAPLVAQARLFPYNYTFFNVVAAAGGVDERWPTDYWRASSRELMRILPAAGPESCAYEQGRRQEPSPCSVEPMFVPYLPERGIDAGDESLAAGEYWLVRENQGRTATPESCRLVDEITRPLWWQSVTIGQVFACKAGS